jgi:hypothetical protein
MAPSSIEHALNEARTSWLCNTTRGDARWKLKELHGLYELLMANRDEIVAAISQGNSLVQLQELAQLTRS